MDNDLLEMAWVLIANAYGGDWDKAHTCWRATAQKWRDEYHATLPEASDEPESPAAA